jgi:hypothetical protein
MMTEMKKETLSKKHKLRLSQEIIDSYKQSTESTSTIKRSKWAQEFKTYMDGSEDLKITTNKQELLDFYKTESLIPSGDSSTRKAKIVKMLTEGGMEVTQAFSDPNCKMAIDYGVRQNLVRIFRYNEDGTFAALNGIVIKNRLLLMPAHFFCGFNKGDRFVVRTHKLDFEIEFENKRLHYLEKKMITFPEDQQQYECHLDRVIYELPSTIPSFKDITGYFVRENDLPKIGDQTSGMIISRNNPAADLMMIVVPKVKQLVSNVALHDDGSHFGILKGFRYNSLTDVGDCGGVIMFQNTNLVGKIGGFHVSGGVDTGTSIVITKEMLERDLYVKEINPVGPPVFEKVQQIVEEDHANLYPLPEGRFSLIGKAPIGEEIFQPTWTEIRPSKIHGKVYPVITGPAALSAKHPQARENNYDPLEQGISKNGEGGKDFPQRLIDEVLEFTILENSEIDPHYPRDILSEEEAINGLESERYLERINMDSSPGYPYTKLKKSGQKGKSAFIAGQGEEDLKVVSEELRKRLDEREKQAKLGVRVPTTWCDTLKDERRPKEKIHKTRIFNIAPIDHTILTKRYFGRFISWYMKNRTKHSGAVGINVDSKEWHNLVMKMREVGDYGFDGDYSKYDSKMRSRLICEYFVDLVNSWYDDGEENGRVRRVLMEETAFSVHRSGNVIYLAYQGNKSGGVVTTVLNCVINDCYIKTGYLYTIEDKIKAGEKNLIPLRNLVEFSKRVRKIVYGDDNWIQAMREILEFFNAFSFSKFLKDHEIDYTPASKGERTEPYSHFSELQFLKRSIRECEYGFYMAPIQKDTIHELTNWIRKCPNQEQAMYDNLVDSLRFAMQWGPEYFRQHRDAINAELRKIELPVLKQTYEMFMREYLMQDIS